MSLMISIFTVDEAGQPQQPRLVEGPHGLAGVERTRTELWGSRAAIALGARFLSRLADADLWIQHDELAAFREECTALLHRARELGDATRWDPEYVSNRLRNFIAAADMAQAVGGGVLID